MHFFLDTFCLGVKDAFYFAEEAGIKPCKEYAIAQYVLEEDTEDIPLIEYEFGRDGRHFLMPEDNFELNTYLPIPDYLSIS